jgi:hypothetical protein
MGAISIVCLAIAIWISLLNWIVFWKRHVRPVESPSWVDVRRIESPSWIPLLGGVLGVVGMLVAPLPHLKAWVWIPLLLDWGSVPGMGYTVWFHVLRKR